MKEIYESLTTPYAENMDRQVPWNYYPRPSLKRDSFLCLNGEWDFAITDGGEPKDYTEKILVPFPPESSLSGICREVPEGKYLYYKRRASLPEGFMRDRLILHFGAVDTICEVFVGGVSVGEHEGGYLPFSFDITNFASVGEFEITVKVKDDLDKTYPYGKQKRKRGGMWYTPVSGIWQTVWLESVPEKHISSLRVESSMKGATLTVVGGENEKRITLKDSGEVFIFTGESVTICPEKIKLWSPEEPYVYDFILESGEDRVESYFALREIAVGKQDGIPRILFNGKPTLFSGLLDQGYFPDGIFLPATKEGYRDDIMLAKKLGFNMLRKHIKVEPEIFYEYCDRLGIFVFADMVNNSSYSFLLDTALPTVGLKRIPDTLRHRGRSREVFLRDMKATIEHIGFFPSVVYYTVFNEGWGQFSADKVFGVAKEADGTRIIDATSGWFTRHESDVDSRHVYFKPVKLGKVGDRPVIISEFGGYSHRVCGHLFGKKNYGYRIFEDEGEFREALGRLYSEEILPQIKDGISGLVYTQLSDVEDETNGLITYDRRHVKVDESEMKKLNEALYNEIK
ncbi:MAG: glycoside hydrolase family 2 [Clostridia bacterium]|nr:glycoside hydrolase family 2 [Clostridia bacterium]